MAAAPSPAEPGRPGSLTEWLRARSDADLAELLRRRPDLALPAPPDLATLAARLGIRTSVQRAVDGLNAFELYVLESLVLAGEDVSIDEFADGAEVRPAIDDLIASGLVWGEPDALNFAPTVADAVGRYPTGLGRPAAMLFAQVPDVVLAPVLRSLGLPPTSQPRAGRSVAALLADPSQVEELLASVSPAEGDVLNRLSAGPPLGTVRNAFATSGDTPAHALITRGLLVPIDAQSVELPREVGLALRAIAPPTIAASAPDVALTTREPAELDRVGTTAVLETIRLVDALATSWTAQPPAQLRSGGVGVRELRRTARDLGVEEPTVALISEVAAAAGLINSTHGMEPVYLPTAEFDLWQRQDTAARWTQLALAWLGMTRQPSLINQRGDRDRMITALSPDAERGTIPALRQKLLDALAALPPGSAPAERSGLLAALAWQAPRRAADQRAEEVLAEADLLGLTAAGGLTGYTRTLLAGSRVVAEQVLTSALPTPVDYFLVQPDLTIVVPGPPTADLAVELAATADLESTGGASVYRVTESSLRRALDTGRTASDIAVLMAQRSRTPVPQSLSYMIDDLARRHGVLRAGTSSAYLRCDDEALLARVMSDRAVSSLGLRQIAPTVVITTAPVARVLDVLRDAGYAPAAEAADGEVVSLGAEAPRAPSHQPVRSVRSRSIGSESQLGELVTRIRSGDAMSELAHTVPTIAQQIPGVTSAATMGVLREAIRDARRIVVGVVESDGTTDRHTILPISMGGGFVRGQEAGSPGLRSFPLHRITAVHLLAPDEDE